MSDQQDHRTTSTEVSRIAKQGIRSPQNILDPAAVTLARELVDALRDGAETPLPAELRQLTEQVRQAATVGFPSIVTSDGARLSAHTIKINKGARPTVIVPSSCTPVGWLLFEYTYLRLAQRGYHVLAYTPRGIGDPTLPTTSQGTSDLVGPVDQADASSVIDYAQAYFEPTRIAFLGESYGAGISQLAAAHDPDKRVAAVAALSPWGDPTLGAQPTGRELLQALFEDMGGAPDDKLEQETWQVLYDFLREENLDTAAAWGASRNSSAYADQTNARGVATFLSATGNETLFPAQQTTDHFASLSVPKRLNRRAGSHGGGVATGLTVPTSGPNPPIDEALAWLDHHVLGIDNAVPTWPETS